MTNFDEWVIREAAGGERGIESSAIPGFPLPMYTKMTQEQCNALRDFLFARRFPAYPDEAPFRYMAVLPAAGDADVVLHYAYAPAIWERAQVEEGPEHHLRTLIATSRFASWRVDLQWHNYLMVGWPLPWGLTAKASSENFPVLVLVERPDASVTGALLRNPHLCNFNANLADEWCEPEEVEVLIANLRKLEVDQVCLSAYKESNVDALTLEEAVANTAESEAGQKEVLVYRDGEWLSSLWSNPASSHGSKGELDFYSVADFHGVRVSEVKRNRRAGMAVAREKQVLAGDYAVLEEALKLAHLGDDEDYEQNPGLKLLCDWWNRHAPEDMRMAGVFRVYHWEAEDNIFIAGDPEEPATQADQMADTPSYAIFEQEGRIPVAVQFFRGRAFNTEDKWGVRTYYANGAEGWSIGCDLHEVDEAYYSVTGLRRLKDVVEYSRNPLPELRW